MGYPSSTPDAEKPNSSGSGDLLFGRFTPQQVKNAEVTDTSTDSHPTTTATSSTTTEAEPAGVNSAAYDDVLPEYIPRKKVKSPKVDAKPETTSWSPYEFNYSVTPNPGLVYEHEERVDGVGNRAGAFEVRGQEPIL
jgi:hypothetical protein